jgi:hypothetical protein
MLSTKNRISSTSRDIESSGLTDVFTALEIVPKAVMKDSSTVVDHGQGPFAVRLRGLPWHCDTSHVMQFISTCGVPVRCELRWP